MSPSLLQYWISSFHKTKSDVNHWENSRKEKDLVDFAITLGIHITDNVVLLLIGKLHQGIRNIIVKYRQTVVMITLIFFKKITERIHYNGKQQTLYVKKIFTRILKHCTVVL